MTVLAVTSKPRSEAQATEREAPEHASTKQEISLRGELGELPEGRGE